MFLLEEIKTKGQSRHYLRTTTVYQYDIYEMKDKILEI